MKRKLPWFLFLIIAIILTLSLTSLVLAQSMMDSQPAGSAQESQSGPDDSDPDTEPFVIIPERFQPSSGDASNGVATAEVYFTPQDENTSTTILFLYNTSAVTATVGLETFRLDGSQYVNTNVNVPASHLVRISADSVSTVSASWQDVILVNFTTFSTYAQMTLPDGVKADGYVVWNDASTYDPIQVAPTLPLRFSVDPPSVFHPTTPRN